MSEQESKLIMEQIPNQERFNELVGRLFEAAQPTAVFSEPITAGEYTVITASEVVVGLGGGFGGGGGASGDDVGQGGGGGGGGSTLARPVAAITVGPNGVHVEPIVDPTKIAITFFTALGAMAMALRKMK